MCEIIDRMSEENEDLMTTWPIWLVCLYIASDMLKPRARWFYCQSNLLNIRIVFLSAAFVHLVVAAVVTLIIDTTVDEDLKVRDYYYMKWKLLTCWFNLIMLAYLPIRLFEDWKTKRGEGSQCIVMTLSHATDVLMTSVLMPTTVFADVLFWSIYLTDPQLLAPVSLFNYMPYWAQHSLHSVSLAVVIIDLLITPRRRPSSMKIHLTFMSAFILLYTSVIYYSLWRGEIVYAFLEHMSLIQLALALLFSLVLHLIFFNVQWYFIDLLWKRKKGQIE